MVFLLTTNRADLLEDALASRPGRVDQAVHIGLPDREARRRLVELYRRGLELDDSRLDTVLDRTDGVTASFLKELLRRAAVVAADREGRRASADAVHVVSADDLDAALDDLLDTRNRMTRRALGPRRRRRRAIRPLLANRGGFAVATGATAARVAGVTPRSPASTAARPATDWTTTSTSGSSRSASSSSAPRSATPTPTRSAPSCCCSRRRTPRPTSSSTSTRRAARSTRAWPSTTR